MINATIYDVGSGKINRRIYCAEELLAAQLQPGEASIKGDYYDEASYISQGRVIDKSKITATLDKHKITANGSELATISGLPQPCSVSLDNTDYPVASGVFQVSFDLPGKHIITVDAGTYLPAEFTLEAI